jgi:hypothetical protein
MSGTVAGLLAAASRAEIILCELEPLFVPVFDHGPLGFPNTAAATVPRFVMTEYVTGGLYASVVGVTGNGISYSAQTSVANVDANAGSWYWDESTSNLYVRPLSGAIVDITVLAKRRLYFATAPVVLQQTPGDPTTAVYYQPWITGDVPTVRRMVEDLLSGATAVFSGTVTFTNAHRAWYGLVSQEGPWCWKNARAKFYLGGSYDGFTLTRSEYGANAMMLVEDVAPSETLCQFALQPQKRITDLELPVTPLFDTDYPHLGDGVRGTKKWIGYGRATIAPDLTDTSTSFGVYTVADAAYQTLFAVNAVWAVQKNTGTRTLLTLTTHYTVNLTACTITIISAAYPYADYTIAADVSGKPDGLGSYLRTYAAIVQDILQTHLGVVSADLDSAAFTLVASDAAQELALWIKGPRTIASLLSTAEPEFPSLGRSVMGTLQETPAGKWTVRAWNPFVDSITTSLRREDFKTFNAKPRIKIAYSTVRVYYGYDHSKEEWSSVEVTDPTIQYKTGSRDRLEMYTYLVSASNARALAQRYLVVAGGVTVEADFEERGALLAQMNAGDKVYVTYTPAPTATGSYVSQPFEVLDLVVKYAPKVTVTGRLGNLRGLGGRVGRWMGSSAPSWASATPTERNLSGFWSSTGGYVDPADLSTLNQSLWW